MTTADIVRLPAGAPLVFRDGALRMTVYLAERRCRRCGRVKVRLKPAGGQWWLVWPAQLEKS